MIHLMDILHDLRQTFNEDAERYDRYRPRYPSEVLQKLINVAKIASTSKLLEIGPGTGQATEPFAEIGCDITGIELGNDLANKARIKLEKYPNVHIITGSFEDADLPVSSYDLIFSATAFHWVQEEYKFVKTAALLKPRSYLAVIHTEHISDDNGDSDQLFMLSEPIYRKYMPPGDPVNEDKNLKLPSITKLVAPNVDTHLFEINRFDVFPADTYYTAKDYTGLLSTYSPTLALSISKRRGFLSEIENLINEQFGGKFKKRFAFTLAIAQKK